MSVRQRKNITPTDTPSKDDTTKEVGPLGIKKPYLTGHNYLGRRQPTETPPFTLDQLREEIRDLFERPLQKTVRYIVQDILLVTTWAFLSLFIFQVSIKIALNMGAAFGWDISPLQPYITSSYTMGTMTNPASWTSFTLPSNTWESWVSFITESPTAFTGAPFLSLFMFNNPVLATYTASLTFFWWLYIYWQGSFFTGVLILGHETLHYALFNNRHVSHVVGWVLHSFLLIPAFSWQISHHHHHSFNRNQNLDEAHMVPHIDTVLPSVSRKHGPDLAPDVEKPKYRGFLRNIKVFAGEVHENVIEFSFPYRVIYYSLYSTIGFILYLFMNASGRKYPASFLPPNHFLPNSPIYTKEERFSVVMSDVGVLLVIYGLYQMAVQFSISTMVLLYLLPWGLSQFYFVMYTLLHHSHVSLPHFSSDNWNYLQGALSTIDRTHGRLHDTIWHNITSHHFVHHLFSTLPFYHAEEATERLKPILGDYYMCTDEDNRWFGAAISMWKAIRDCTFIAEDDHPGLVLAAVAHETSKKHGVPLDHPIVEKAVEEATEEALANDPHKGGRNISKEIYWYRTFQA